jgi:uncharacterized protein YutE (UPF0331/DUF86 family)
LDLVILNDAKPVLQGEAVLKGRLLYTKPDEDVMRFEARHETSVGNGMTLHRDLLQELERNLLLLEELRHLDQAEFLGNPRHYLLAERCFQLAIQCVMDMGYTLASFHQWQRPEDGRDAILVLGRQGILPAEFAAKIAPRAHFRNVLVYAYLGINRELVYRYLTQLDDFRTFLRHLDVYLNPE